MKFTKGFKNVRDRVRKGSKYTMSCYNCEYYYQAEGDTEEVCQNPSVLKYDMVITQNSIYCNYWKLCKRNRSKKGVETVERKKIAVKKARKKSSERD